MTYEPFALKYRPRVFADVVGQGGVAETLRNALRTDRVANAFLFSGSRGVGKTSMARILAKALNCPEGLDGEPCGSCEQCESIAHGDDLDVIEVDGASNRGIDEIRTIRDNVGYAPARGRYKVYIIDEVHMLTIQAFNALLKTLEEPPPHVKFVFATTEPQAVPETIVSRCQRYEFHRITPSDIVARLRHICERENIEGSDDVLGDIAEKAEGGLRDSVSLLDQLVAFAGDRPTLADLDRVLGRIDTEILEGILRPTCLGETAPVLDGLDAAFESGRDAEEVLTQVTDLLREAMVRDARGLPGGGDGRRAGLVALLREHFSLDRLLFALRICLNTRREIKQVGQARLQLELAFLKLARSVDLLPLQEVLTRLADDAPSPGERTTPSGAAVAQPPPHRKAKPSTEPPPPAAKPPRRAAAAEPDKSQTRPGPLTLELLRAQWTRLQDEVKKSRPRIAALFEEARPAALRGTEVIVELPVGWDFQKRQLSGVPQVDFERALDDVFGAALTLTFQVSKASLDSGEKPRKKIHEDPTVRKIIDSFGGGVVAIEQQEQDDEGV